MNGVTKYEIFEFMNHKWSSTGNFTDDIVEALELANSHAEGGITSKVVKHTAKDVVVIAATKKESANPKLVKGCRVLKKNDRVNLPGTGMCSIINIDFSNNTVELEHCQSGNSWDMIEFSEIGANRVN